MSATTEELVLALNILQTALIAAIYVLCLALVTDRGKRP